MNRIAIVMVACIVWLPPALASHRLPMRAAAAGDRVDFLGLGALPGGTTSKATAISGERLVVVGELLATGL